MRRHLLVLAVAIGAVPLLAGCAFLETPSFDEGFGEPLATYVSGRATLEIDGRTIVLDHLSDGPHLIKGFGGEVYWYSTDGWGVRVTSYDGSLMASNEVTIDRVQTTYWSAPGYGDCTVKVEKADETGIKGSAKCDGLRWVDRLRGGSEWSSEPSYVVGEPAFDAIVQFEAWPELRTTTSEPPGTSPGASAT